MEKMKNNNSSKASLWKHTINPKNWTFFCCLIFILSILLIIDLILGVIFQAPIVNYSYLSIFFPNNDFFLRILPLIILLIILLLAPFLNQQLANAPFFMAIIIIVLIYLAGIQYTLLGVICEFFLTTGCSIIIFLILINIIIFENDDFIDTVSVFLIGVALLTVHLTVNIINLFDSIQLIWGIIYLSTIILGIILILKQHILIAAIPIFIFSVLNGYILDYFLPVGLSGFDVGSSLILLGSLFLIIQQLMYK